MWPTGISEKITSSELWRHRVALGCISFICLLPFTSGVQSVGLEAGALVIWEVECSKAPGPMEFTLTYDVPISMAITAAESCMLLVMYSYKRIIQDPMISFGGLKFGTKDSSLRRSMFHLLGFWGKVQRFLVGWLWYITAFLTPKPVTVKLQESFELYSCKIETGSHLSLWRF